MTVLAGGQMMVQVKRRERPVVRRSVLAVHWIHGLHQARSRTSRSDYLLPRALFRYWDLEYNLSILVRECNNQDAWKNSGISSNTAPRFVLRRQTAR